MSTSRIHQRFTLEAGERLQLRKQIETLFRAGEAFSVFPLRIICAFVPRMDKNAAPVRVGFSIPKKRIRKAVDRNRIRRLLREAWRLQKHALYRAVPDNLQIHCFLIYSGPQKFDWVLAQLCVKKTLSQLEIKVKEKEIS